VADKHTNVFTALCAAQLQFGQVKKGSVNPAFKSKYADLADVAGVVIPTLAENGVAVFHYLANGGRDMRTEFNHGESGTRIWCDVPLMVDKQNMQGMKSAVTYAKRIGLESLSGIAPEDDDGNAAVVAAPKETIASGALRDAWRDAVEDSLTENATPRQKAEAYADAIVADFASVKKRDTLDGRWTRHVKMIEAFAERQPDLHAKIVQAYETHPAFTE
jgi:hypothetical protein